VVVEDCTVQVGPNVTVGGPGGALTVRFGHEMIFVNEVVVGTDATLTVERDPSLIP
jgi:hypothetical protein